MLLITKELAFWLYSNCEQPFSLEERLLTKLEEKLKNIEIIILKEDYDEFPSRDIVKTVKNRKITMSTTEELIDRVNKGELRYSESKEDQRFKFYNNIEKELRSIIVGTSNFLLIRGIEDLTRDLEYNYYDGAEIWESIESFRLFTYNKKSGKEKNFNY